CIAVGHRADPAGAQVTLAEAGNGTSWSVLKTPNPPGAQISGLSDVSCTSATFCIAVGAFSTWAGGGRWAEGWDAGPWSIQQPPALPHGGPLTGLACPSASSCVAVGFYSTASGQQPLAEVWNGTAWSIHDPAARPNDSE